jgi:serine/threonine-protein kinase
MAGVNIQHYELQEKLGAGGMGEVFKAHDKRLNRFVAIKVLPLARSGSPERRRRFLQEAQTASGLNHPNIITIHDILDEGDTQYLVMEYVTGKTLHETIPTGGLRVALALQYAVQMADALSAAHSAGIIHRDFKPANVMVTKQGLIKILDFGLAKIADSPPSHGPEAGETAAINLATLVQGPLTTEGAILGTVSYMSPEQAEGRRVDARSDIFAFGAVLYEMVTGKRAFQGTSDLSTLTSVLRDAVTPIPEVAPEVPHEVEEIVTLCLKKAPDERYQSMNEVSMALSALKRRSDAGALRRPGSPGSSGQHELPTPRPSATGTRTASGSAPKVQPAAQTPGKKTQPKALVAALGGVLVIGAAAGAGWWWTNHRSSPAASVAKSTPAVQTPAQPVPPPAAAPPPAESQQAPNAAPPAPPAGASATPPTGTPATATKNSTSTTASNTAPKRDAAAKSVPAPAAPPPSPSSPAAHEALPPIAAPPRVANESVAISVGDGSPFLIALDEDVPADAAGGQTLTFRVTQDFKVSGTVVIARGALVTGSIATEGGKKRFLGMGGKMTFQLESAEAVDGQKIKVRALAARKSDGPTARPIDTGKYAKPKDAAAARGTDYTAYIDGDQTVSIRH